MTAILVDLTLQKYIMKNTSLTVTQWRESPWQTVGSCLDPILEGRGFEWR